MLSIPVPPNQRMLKTRAYRLVALRGQAMINAVLLIWRIACYSHAYWSLTPASITMPSGINFPRIRYFDGRFDTHQMTVF